MGTLRKGIIAPQIKRNNMIERDIKTHFFAGVRNSDILKTAVDMKFEKINDQTCFCTDEALKTLHFKESYEVQKISWK